MGKADFRVFAEYYDRFYSQRKDYKNAYEQAGFEEVEYITDNLWDGCRGLFLALK